ncbi:hypothetical protein V1477_016105 [Vespula maculifrons]|uniref:Uncharacterized protein n=1 Tax=Vespula maculifrons TaxID=7453 RepID=A0ABD2BC38_VESMC
MREWQHITTFYLTFQLYFLLRRVDLEIFTRPFVRVLTKSLRKHNIISHIFSKLYTISFVLDFDFALSEDIESLSPRGDIEIFTGCYSCEY